MSAQRLLDLFCREGGAGEGYRRTDCPDWAAPFIVGRRVGFDSSESYAVAEKRAKAYVSARGGFALHISALEHTEGHPWHVTATWREFVPWLAKTLRWLGLAD